MASVESFVVKWEECSATLRSTTGVGSMVISFKLKDTLFKTFVLGCFNSLFKFCSHEKKNKFPSILEFLICFFSYCMETDDFLDSTGRVLLCRNDFGPLSPLSFPLSAPEILWPFVSSILLQSFWDTSDGMFFKRCFIHHLISSKRVDPSIDWSSALPVLSLWIIFTMP